MKTFVKLFVILTVTLSLGACKTSVKAKDYTLAVVGNTSGNINNGSAMLEFDGWVYYSIGSFGESPPYVTPDDGFYRMKPNGTEKQKISSDILSALNAFDKTIYSSSNFTNIFKTLSTDLTTVKIDIFSTMYALRMVTVDDRLIVSSGGNYSLYSAKNDGNDVVKLSSLPSFRSDFNKGWIYYVTDDPATMHRVQIDGTQDVLVSDDIGKDFIIVNDRIYYPSLSDGHKLYSVGLTGDKPVKITENAVSSLNSDGNRIFYIDPITRKIHALSFNGKVDEPISSNVANKISIAGGWIYYSDNQVPAQIFQISLSNWTEKTFYSLKKDEPVISEVENKGMAISNENFHSGGLFAQSKEWIYTVVAKGDGIFKIHADGSNKTKISDVHASNLVILGDWIYFINLDQDQKVFRIKTNGSELTLVFDNPTDNFLVNDNWIYMTTKDGGIIKTQTNGTDRIDLIYFPHDTTFKMYAIANNKVFRDESLGDIVEMDLNGTPTAIAKTGEFGIEDVFVHDDWIFYIVPSYSDDLTAKIYKIKRDGSSKTLVESLAQGGMSFGFYENWLYFSSVKDNEALVRLDVESGKREVLFRGKPLTNLFFLDGKIVSVRLTDVFSEAFISDMDGSNQTPFYN